MYVLVQFSIYPLKRFFFFGQALYRCIQYTQFTSPVCVCACVCVCLRAIFQEGKSVKIKYDIVGVYDIINGCHMRAVAFHLVYCLRI